MFILGFWKDETVNAWNGKLAFQTNWFLTSTTPISNFDGGKEFCPNQLSSGLNESAHPFHSSIMFRKSRNK